MPVRLSKLGKKSPWSYFPIANHIRNIGKSSLRIISIDEPETRIEILHAETNIYHRKTSHHAGKKQSRKRVVRYEIHHRILTKLHAVVKALCKLHSVE